MKQAACRVPWKNGWLEAGGAGEEDHTPVSAPMLTEDTDYSHPPPPSDEPSSATSS
jgi:hypothetical protein